MKLEIQAPVLILSLVVLAVVLAARSKPAVAKRPEAIPHPPTGNAERRATDRIDRANAEVRERIVDYAANR